MREQLPAALLPGLVPAPECRGPILGRGPCERGVVRAHPAVAACLFSHVLHDWGEDEVRRLLAASYAALPPGGLLVDHDVYLNAGKTGPLAAAEYSVLLMHSTPADAGPQWN